MKAKTKALLIMAWVLCIGATLFLIYGFSWMRESMQALGELLGVLIVMVMYMIGAFCLGEWIKAWQKEAEN